MDNSYKGEDFLYFCKKWDSSSTDTNLSDSNVGFGVNTGRKIFKYIERVIDFTKLYVYWSAIKYSMNRIINSTSLFESITVRGQNL